MYKEMEYTSVRGYPMMRCGDASGAGAWPGSGRNPSPRPPPLAIDRLVLPQSCIPLLLSSPLSLLTQAGTLFVISAILCGFTDSWSNIGVGSVQRETTEYSNTEIRAKVANLQCEDAKMVV